MIGIMELVDRVSPSGKEGQDQPNTPQPAPQSEEEESNPDQRAEDSREQFYSVFPGGHA